MNRTDFHSRLIGHSNADGFTFLLPDKQLEDPKRLSASQQALFSIAAGALWGLLGSLSTGYLDDQGKEQLIQDLARLKEHADLVSIHLSSGHVVLRLVIDADDMTDEAIIGRASLVHEKAHDFRKYALTFMRTIISDGRMCTYVQFFVVFSSHRRAKDFLRNFADKCNHTAFWKKVHTKACVVDLEDEEMTAFSFGLGHFLNRQLAKLKSDLFHGLVG